MHTNDVVWVEGTLLTQQHLQRWDQQKDRYFKQAFMVERQFNWGLIELEIEVTKLENAVLAVRSLKAIMPNGCYIEYCENTDPPLFLDLKLEQSSDITVVLCQNDAETLQGISGYPDVNSWPAWRVVYTDTKDRYDAARCKEVAVQRPVLRLLTKNSVCANYCVLPIIKIIVERGYDCRIDKEYIPPLPSAHLSESLTVLLAQVSGRIWQKIIDIQAALRIVTRGQRYDAIFWQQVTLQRYYYQFRNFLSVKFIKPYEVFSALANACHELNQFITEQLIHEVEQYQHAESGIQIKCLALKLMILLDALINDELHSISLEPINRNIWLARITEYCDLQQPVLYLKFARLDSVDAVELTKVIKVAPPQLLESLMVSATAGAEIEPALSPARTKAEESWQYYRVKVKETIWQAIIKHREIAFYLPDKFAHLEFYLYAVI